MVRYADDFVVLCRSRDEAEAALARIRRWVADNGLRLHPDKTHIGDCRQSDTGLSSSATGSKPAGAGSGGRA